MAGDGRQGVEVRQRGIDGHIGAEALGKGLVHTGGERRVIPAAVLVNGWGGCRHGLSSWHGAERAPHHSHAPAIVDDQDAREYASEMATTVEELIEQAMTLPSEARARLGDLLLVDLLLVDLLLVDLLLVDLLLVDLLLVDLLVESLDADELGPIDHLWLAEARRRRDDVQSGRIQTINGDEGLRTVRSSLRR